MIIPAELTHRVCKTKLSGLGQSFKRLDQIRKEWQGSEIDVVYENARPIVVVVFESPEDCLAFTLKYGKEYV
jgi:hypothetical protein